MVMEEGVSRYALFASPELVNIAVNLQAATKKQILKSGTFS